MAWNNSVAIKSTFGVYISGLITIDTAAAIIIILVIFIVWLWLEYTYLSNLIPLLRGECQTDHLQLLVQHVMNSIFRNDSVFYEILVRK